MNGKATSLAPFHFAYRPDIEGLRALAILLVVGAHADIPGLDGGFIGVDVFFVLSGYLITGLLIGEWRHSGRINMAAFYLRRVRRLAPGLLVMLLGSGLLASWLLVPSEQATQAIAGASATFWLSNFHFALSRMDYFSPASENNLFLHTWSLGVEEQFYLVWPVLITAVMGTAVMSNYKPRMFLTLALLFASSLILCLWLTHHSPQLAFYMMPARAWQFALGGGTLLLADHYLRPESVASRTVSLMGWIGAGLILGGSLLLDSQALYPGLWALLPSIGAASILFSGHLRPDTGLYRLLSRAPMQRLGGWSYAWYLWHWPVLLLGSAALPSVDTWQKLCLAILALAIAAISHRYIELPIRKSTLLLRRAAISWLSTGALLITVAALALHWQKLATERSTGPDQLRLQQVRLDLPSIYAAGCDQWYRSADLTPCIFGPEDAPRTAVVMGDSIGLQWFPAYERIFQPPAWRLVVLTKSACPMVDEPIYYERIRREFTECTQWRAKALRYVASLRPDVVILGSTFTYRFNEEQWTGGTQRVLEQIRAYSNRIYLLRSTPFLPFSAPSCLARARDGASLEACIAPALNAQADAVFMWQERAAAMFENVKTIDLTPVVCPHGICRAELDGQLTFRDTQHLSAQFAASLAPELAKALDDEGG